ncbi:MAG TPA: 4-(cytidine 5'-diphospho)-2-C-methyl-D-erythritol kinase [Candidatus Eisenbacteria bacterium]|nr:4-(cytidine 5'-diphospho)-2-C-methyl-D-erythritol kinase [Candidatus Eisenbacteria bacterium]
MTRAARAAAPPALAAVRVHAPAKVNLGLWILGRRPDGFHEIDTILHAIDLDDEILIARSRVPGCRLSTAGRPIPPGPAPNAPNLVERAWSRLLAARPELERAGIDVRLTKRIPAGAGLGGGSSDAAGLLAGADRLFGLGMEPDELEVLAADLGSDCPFFVRGGAARATGRGEELRHLRPMPPTWGVLLFPPVAISTSWAYGLLRKRLTVGTCDASILESAVARGDVGAAVDARFNAFEDVILPHVPILAGLREHFFASGGWGPLMSGSGSSFFTLARSENEARAVASAIAKSHADVRVMRTRERGVTVSRAE